MNKKLRKEIALDPNLIERIEQIALLHFDAKIHNVTKAPMINDAILELLKLGIKSFENQLESKLESKSDRETFPLEDISNSIIALSELEYLSSQDLKDLISIIIKLNLLLQNFYLESIEFQDEDLDNMIGDRLEVEYTRMEYPDATKKGLNTHKIDNKISPQKNGGNGVVKARNKRPILLSDSDIASISAIPNIIIKRIRLGKIQINALSPKSQKILAKYKISEDGKKWINAN